VILMQEKAQIYTLSQYKTVRLSKNIQA